MKKKKRKEKKKTAHDQRSSLKRTSKNISN